MGKDINASIQQNRIRGVNLCNQILPGYFIVAIVLKSISKSTYFQINGIVRKRQVFF